MAATSTRLTSIDVLRGLTVAFMIIVNTPGSHEFAFAPLKHADWNGCTPTDLVFPFFVFIVGLSMAQSFRKFETSDRMSLLTKAFIRTLIIFGVGLFLNWFPFYHKNIADLRIFGVLQRIALAYFFASLIIIFIKEKWHMAVTMAVLMLYYLLLIFGVTEGPLDLMTNLVRKIDLWLVGDHHIYHGYRFNGERVAFDPEGFLSTMGSVGNVMFGYILASKMRNTTFNSSKIKMAGLFGLLLTCLGVAWHYLGFPINKPIWSSSYAMFSSGLCAVLFALLIFVIDEKKIEKWAYPFKVFGMNALAAYALSSLVDTLLSYIRINDKGSYQALYEDFTSPVFGPYLGSLISALLFCFLIWLFAYAMYKKNIFLKA